MGGMADARGQKHFVLVKMNGLGVARGLCGLRWATTSINLGESVTKFDAQMAAFRPALALIEYLLKNQYYQGPMIVLSNTKATVPKFMDTRPGPDQPTILDIAWH
jgi:hypothetical protein